MDKIDVLVAAADHRMRERLVLSLPRARLSFADRTEEVLARLLGPAARGVLIWDLEPDGEFDQRALDLVRKIRPALPVLVLDEACDGADGGRSLSLDGLVFLPRAFRRRALRDALERGLASHGEAADDEPEDREALAHYARESLAAKLVFEHLPVAALVVDENERVLAINEEARRLSGAAASAVGKTTCRALWHCRIPRTRCPLRKSLLRQCPVYRTEVPVSTAHGQRTMIERLSTFQDPSSGERRAVVTCGDATGFVKRMHRLSDQARVDSLTRLLNRGRFEEALSRCASRRERRRKPSLFVMIDVDGLKQVNDREGHAAGDRLLRRLGSLLQRQTRRGDLVGRLGGDEFGIHCSHIARGEARELVRRLRAAVKQDNAAHPGEARLSIGIGVSYSGDGGKDQREEADMRLRRYKTRRRRRGAAAQRSPDR